VKPNEVIKKLSLALSLNRDDIKKIFEAVEFEIDDDRLDAILAKPSSKKYQVASYEELGNFLDGLIAFKRGEIAKRPDEDEEVILDNNLILKKIRVALQLKEYEISIIFALVDREVSKSTIRDIFRNPNHPKFKRCSNAMLEDFLDGLDEFYFDGGED